MQNISKKAPNKFYNNWKCNTFKATRKCSGKKLKLISDLPHADIIAATLKCPITEKVSIISVLNFGFEYRTDFLICNAMSGSSNSPEFSRIDLSFQRNSQIFLVCSQFDTLKFDTKLQSYSVSQSNENYMIELCENSIKETFELTYFRNDFNN